MSGDRRRETKKESKSNTHTSTHSKRSFWQNIVYIYCTEWKKLMIVPFLLLILSFGILGYSYIKTGEFVEKGVSIKGGTSVTISTKTINAEDMRRTLEQEFPKSSIESRTISASGSQTGIIIEASDINTETLQNLLQTQYNIDRNDYTVETTGSSLGASFYNQLILAIIAAFIMMGIVVYFYFRSLVPSAAIILAAFSDMITTLAILNLMGVKLTAAGIAAILMLIGYSVDTDVLLTARVLKRKEGTVDERVFSAIKTGTTMTITAITTAALAIIFTQSETIHQIMLILIIGLLADLVYTWIQNVSLLKWYLERRGELQK